MQGSGVEHSENLKVQNIDLSKEKVAEPFNAWRVHEGYFAVETYSSAWPYIVTYGLDSCKEIAIYNANNKKGAVCHLAMVHDLDAVVNGLVTEFGGDLTLSEAFVVVGTHQVANRDTKSLANLFGRGEKYYWPTGNQLIETLGKFNPNSLSVDKNYGKHPRGITLNLENGQLKEIDNAKIWSWSRKQNISGNKTVDSID